MSALASGIAAPLLLLLLLVMLLLAEARMQEQKKRARCEHWVRSGTWRRQGRGERAAAVGEKEKKTVGSFPLMYVNRILIALEKSDRVGVSEIEH